MKRVAFIDTEIEPNSKRILDLGCINQDDNTFHSSSVPQFAQFIKDTEFICGHNIVRHDLIYLQEPLKATGLHTADVIDTLFLSPLLFPKQPYHALIKDDKWHPEESNNPLNDAIKARDLFFAEVNAFKAKDADLQQIFYCLLKGQQGFQGFFTFIEYQADGLSTSTLIRKRFEPEVCAQAELDVMIERSPVELAYCLALIDCQHRYSITPPWVIKSYPAVEGLMRLLRNKPCLSGCAYCDQALDIHKGLKDFFKFDTFRKYGDEPLQEKAVQAAIDNKSLLAIFPTGGGKSITFQVPALMCGRNIKGLTVVISPLQSLMKDQVDNLEKAEITEAVTINGLLDPIERAKSFERVENGSASILYISPESLRSRTIEKLLLGRKIARFVIDEAHCFSSWGQDFRVDYLYIGDFIRQLQKTKNLEEPIPVSCFTATAKQNVIEDIQAYFKQKLSLNLEIFRSTTSRTNLQYKVLEKGSEDEKYAVVRNLIEEKKCPSIVYVSRTGTANKLAARLETDGFNAKAFHGKMEVQQKTANQNAFIAGEVQIMVATSAFGMGVDKKDVGMVIHYEISDSLENYIQEAGRAGRDEHITAECFVLFNEEDLTKHFILLNQTKLSIKEIQQVWKAIKDLTKVRASISNSALEIARKAGWDDHIAEIETRVTTAIAALEDAGYVKRGQNMPRVFANSILTANAQEAINKIATSDNFDEKQREHAGRIIKKLFSSKSRKHATGEAAESRIDYLADHLGLSKEEVIHIINLLREEKILADKKDLSAYIKRGENKNRSLNIVEVFGKAEEFLLTQFEEEEQLFHLKDLNESAELYGCKAMNPNKLKTILNIWAIKGWIKRHASPHSRNHFTVVCPQSKEILKEKLSIRHELAQFIATYLYTKAAQTSGPDEDILVEFSVHELKEAFEQSANLFQIQVTLDDIEDTLFYLSRIEALKIEGGFLVIYNKLRIDRLESDNKIKYKLSDYDKLNSYYEQKVQQIHIVGEYAKKMLSDYEGALKFVDDYFQLRYDNFLSKYFPGRQHEIKRHLTPAKFKQLFGTLSAAQLEIIKDGTSKYIVVAAGPGSGKTRLLVHKLASLLYLEDVKHEQMLMVTFSRAAATEFKKRLLELIAGSAHFVEIKTFHSYCFDLLGRVGSLERSNEVLRMAIDKIKSGDVEESKITKTVLVIDEAQDMDVDEYELINTLIERNEDMRVIAVGDDDQNIYVFRGADSAYLEDFIQKREAKKYELIENYRSKQNLVEFANHFVTRIEHRLKELPIQAHQSANGVIDLVRYRSNNLVTPIVNAIGSSTLHGSTCVLTKSNEEASQITGLLLKQGLPAKLIQDHDGFNLYNLLEVRFFINALKLEPDTFLISEEAWEDAKRTFTQAFKQSSKAEICLAIIRDFETANPQKKYKSDLEIFIRESKIEDFAHEAGGTILVSTIHKAKGMEWI
jgi:ATP-dependent DNA helicase RecQ